MPPIDADDLDAFRVFAESRSFVVAAKALAITQPAAFLRVRKLSESLGATLYRREGRTLSLTDAGIKTLAHARDVHAASSALRARLAGEDAEPRLVLATGEGALLTLLAASIAELAKGPMKLQVKVLDAASTLEAVRGATADVGVLPLHAAPDDLHARILARVGFVALMPARHRLARRRSIRPADLAGVPLVVPPASGPHRLAIERFVARDGIEPTIGAEASGWTVLARLASLGLGVAIVPSRTAIPRGAVARPVAGFPELVYRAVRRRRVGTPNHVVEFFDRLRGDG